MNDSTDMPQLDRRLDAGQTRVLRRVSSETTRRMGAERGAPRDQTLAEGAGPWGRLRISADGYPLIVRAQIDEQVVATLTATTANLHEDGPVLTFTDRDVPLVLGDLHTDLRFVAQGSRLRPAGRKRFLRVTTGERAWTYGSSETQTANPHPLGRVVGSLNVATELRRGAAPATGEVCTWWRGKTSQDEK